MLESFENRLQTVCLNFLRSVPVECMLLSIQGIGRAKVRACRKLRCKSVSQEKLNAVVGRIRYRRIRYDMHYGRQQETHGSKTYLYHSVDDSRGRRRGRPHVRNIVGSRSWTNKNLAS